MAPLPVQLQLGCSKVSASCGYFWSLLDSSWKFSHEFSTCSDSGISSNGQNIPKSKSWMKAFNIPLLDSFASHDVLLSLLHRCIMYALCFGMFRIMSVNLGPGFPSYIDKIVIDGVKKSHWAPRYGNMPSKMWPVAPSREPRSERWLHWPSTNGRGKDLTGRKKNSEKYWKVKRSNRDPKLDSTKCLGSNWWVPVLPHELSDDPMSYTTHCQSAECLQMCHGQ